MSFTASRKPKLDLLDKPGLVEFQYDAASFDVTPEMQQVFDWDGCFTIKNLFSQAEIDKILLALTSTDELTGRAWDVADGEGRASRLVLWGHPGSDITGMVARCEKVSGLSEKLLGGEVYHYHTKLMMKEPHTGGKHLWHQDYGYWYKNGNLRPDLVTIFIALDPCVKANGCLQVVKGTHRCGRIDHDLLHGQTVASQERIDQIVKQPEYEHCYGELQPGDALVLHCNVLHTSNRNDSDMRRWAFLCSYNRADNDPVYVHHHPNYTPLHKVPNEAVLACDNFTDLSGKEILDPTQDQTVRAKLVESKFH